MSSSGSGAQKGATPAATAAATWWSSVQHGDVYMLFELFPHNAEPFAHLRVSALAEGKPQCTNVFDRAFSIHQVFTFSSSTDPSRQFRSVLDNFEASDTPSCIHVEHSSARDNDNEDDMITISVKVPSMRSPIQLRLSNRLTKSTFLDRVMRYFTSVNHTLLDMHHDLHHLNIQRDDLVNKMQAAVQAKMNHDKKLRNATAILMHEKTKKSSSS